MDIYDLFLKYASEDLENEENPFITEPVPETASEIETLKKYQTKGAKLPDEFWKEFIEVSKRLGTDPKNLAQVVRGESGFDTTAIAKNEKTGNPIAKGLNQMTTVASDAIKMPRETWDRYESLSGLEQLAWLETFMKGQKIKGLSAVDIYIKNFGSHNNPDGSMYASLAYIDAHPLRDKFKNAELQDIQYKANKNIDLVYGNKDGAISKDDMVAYLRAIGKF